MSNVIDELLFLSLDQMVAVARARLRRKIAERLQARNMSCFGLVTRDKHLAELSFLAVSIKKLEVL